MAKEVVQQICQKFKFFKNNTGYCKKKEDYQASKATCRYFEKRRK